MKRNGFKHHILKLLLGALVLSALITAYLFSTPIQLFAGELFTKLTFSKEVFTTLHLTKITLGLSFVTILYLTIRLASTKVKINNLIRRHKELLVRQHQEVGIIKGKLQSFEEQLQVQDIAKEKFLKIVTKDLKNPLLALKSYVYTLKTKEGNFSPWELTAYAASLEKSLNHLIAVLNNASLWSMVQNSFEPIQTDSININKMITYTLKLMKPTADKKHIALLKNIDCQVEVMSDAHMIEFILRNLISNAIKFSHDNSVVMVKMREEDGQFTISVKDQGIGMDEATISKLFTINEKSPAIDSRKPVQAGLGLMLCKEFTQKMGGTIEVHSRPNEGALFQVNLPKDIYQPSKIIRQ